MGLWWILKNGFTIRCHQSNVASWKIPALNEGCSWENHRTKWWIFQQNTFDYRMVREFEGKIMENQVLGALPALPSNERWRKPLCNSLIEGSLEVKLPTIWTVEKQRWEESEEKRSEERRCRCAKRYESRETLCFSNDLWLRRVEK